MLNASKDALDIESKVRQLEVHLRELSNIHQSLNSLSVQATLIVGFSLASLSADNLATLGDDSSSFCIYKGDSMALGFLFVLCNSISISLNITVVGISSYLTYRSQRAALDTNTEAATTKLRLVSVQIYCMFVVALVAFFISAILIVWLFIGVNNWVDAPSNSVVDNETVILTDGGNTKIRCLDSRLDSDAAHQYSFGRLVALTNTVVFIVAIFLGCAFALHVARQFDEDRLEEWYERRLKARKARLERKAFAKQANDTFPPEIEMRAGADNVELVGTV